MLVQSIMWALFSTVYAYATARKINFQQEGWWIHISVLTPDPDNFAFH